jgi:hypothetical protein
MPQKAWVIPIATLSSIVGLSLVFIWWWLVFYGAFFENVLTMESRFPRTWKKGNKDEMAAVMADREAQLQLQQQQQQNVPQGLADNGETPAGQIIRPKSYTPQVYTAY